MEHFTGWLSTYWKAYVRKVPRGTLQGKRAFQSVTDCNGFTRAFQSYASNASDVQMQVMCRCEFVALGGAGGEVARARGYLSDQPAS